MKKIIIPLVLILLFTFGCSSTPKFASVTCSADSTYKEYATIHEENKLSFYDNGTLKENDITLVVNAEDGHTDVLTDLAKDLSNTYSKYKSDSGVNIGNTAKNNTVTYYLNFNFNNISDDDKTSLGYDATKTKDDYISEYTSNNYTCK